MAIFTLPKDIRVLIKNECKNLIAKLDFDNVVKQLNTVLHTYTEEEFTTTHSILFKQGSYFHDLSYFMHNNIIGDYVDTTSNLLIHRDDGIFKPVAICSSLYHPINFDMIYDCNMYILDKNTAYKSIKQLKNIYNTITVNFLQRFHFTTDDSDDSESIDEEMETSSSEWSSSETEWSSSETEEFLSNT
jgi:hypothetical protein